MTTVWENWRTPATEGGTITGTVEFAAPVMRDAGALTLAPIPDPVTVAGGEMSTDIPPGLYEVTIRLTYTTTGGQTRTNSDSGAIVRVSVPESGSHRLRDLIAVGAVPTPPATWFDIASSTFLTQADADANYAPATGIAKTALASGVQTSLGAADTAVQPAALTAEATARSSGDAALIAQLAANPDQIAVGTITRSTSGAVTGFTVAWPDGATGTFVGTESTTAPGAIDSYTVTHVLSGVTKTYTQPSLTRDSSGAVTARPAIVVS